MILKESIIGCFCMDGFVCLGFCIEGGRYFMIKPLAPENQQFSDIRGSVRRGNCHHLSLDFFHFGKRQSVSPFRAAYEKHQGTCSSRNGGSQKNGKFGQVQEAGIREGDGGNEDGHGKADTAEHAGSCQLPGRGFAGNVYMAYFMEKVDRAEDAYRFSKEESRQDAPGEGGSKVQRSKGNFYACIGKGKNGHDEICRPGVKSLLPLMKHGYFAVPFCRNREAQNDPGYGGVNTGFQEKVPCHKA